MKTHDASSLAHAAPGALPRALSGFSSAARTLAWPPLPTDDGAVKGTSPQAVTLAAAPYLTRGVELLELLQALVAACAEQVGADKGTLYLVDGAAGVLQSIVTDAPAVIRLELGQGLAGVVAKEGHPVNVKDAAADPRFYRAFDEATGYRTRSVLAVPVRDTQGHVIGVLQLLNARAGEFVAQDEAQALELSQQVGTVLERTSLYAELKRQSSLGDSKDRPGLAFRFNQIVGESEAMKRVYAVVEKAARTEATVLVQGESGTGKELIARAIHVNSARKGMPFIKVDCTTLPEALIENELFGHEKGAFTGADKTTAGKFEVAQGGTLFIDEIGELPLKLQGKLLRVLQDREFERVGGTKTLLADIRVICATHRDLAAMVDKGAFREDLYYRIKVVPMVMPPLRERGTPDLLRLVEHFVDKFGRRHKCPHVRISEGALQRLQAHPFPGNIRELEHVIESAVVLCDADVIEAGDLALPDRNDRSVSAADASALLVGDPELSLATVEREHVRLVLKACGGNQSEAARRLGIGRNTLARKLSSPEGDPIEDD